MHQFDAEARILIYPLFKKKYQCKKSKTQVTWRFKSTHNADSIIESKVIYYLEQCGLGV